MAARDRIAAVHCVESVCRGRTSLRGNLGGYVTLGLYKNIPSKMSPEQSWPPVPLYVMVPCVPKVRNPNVISIRSAILAGLTSVWTQSQTEYTEHQ